MVVFRLGKMIGDSCLLCNFSHDLHFIFRSEGSRQNSCLPLAWQVTLNSKHGVVICWQSVNKTLCWLCKHGKQNNSSSYNDHFSGASRPWWATPPSVCRPSSSSPTTGGSSRLAAARHGLEKYYDVLASDRGRGPVRDHRRGGDGQGGGGPPGYSQVRKH